MDKNRILLLSDKDLLDEVIKLVMKSLKRDNLELDGTTRFREDLNLDSIDYFFLALAVEEEYGVVISDKDAISIRNIKDLSDYIRLNLNNLT